MEKVKLILFDVSLLKEKYFLLKTIRSLINLRCNSVSINQNLLELLSIYFITAVHSWKSTTLKLTNKKKRIHPYKKYYKLLVSKYSIVQDI